MVSGAPESCPAPLHTLGEKGACPCQLRVYLPSRSTSLSFTKQYGSKTWRIPRLQVEAICIPRKILKKKGSPSPQSEYLLSKVAQLWLFMLSPNHMLNPSHWPHYLLKKKKKKSSLNKWGQCSQAWGLTVSSFLRSRKGRLPSSLPSFKVMDMRAHKN